MNVFEQMQQAVREITRELPTMAWTVVNPVDSRVLAWTGRGAGWTVQLICLEGERMGTAAKGGLILKLTDEQCEAAERYARFVPAPRVTV